jgi:hypothetical protein
MRSIIELPRTVLPNLDLTVKTASDGLSLMHVAVLADNRGLVELLCQYSQSLVNSRSETHVTPLHLAATHGLHDIAEVLLGEFHAFVNARDDDGMTALLFACRHGHLRLAKLLVKHGANVTVEEDEEGTALHLACRAGDFAMMKWLVRRGLRPDEKSSSSEGVSPQHIVLSLLAWAGGGGSKSSEEEDDEEDEEEDADGKVEVYGRMADWLAAWSLADKMGLSVEDVLAEMSSEKKKTTHSVKSSKSAAASGGRSASFNGVSRR